MELTPTEQQQLKDFLATVYGPGVASWPMSDEIFNLTYRMLDESRTCSDLMDHVPRPMPIGARPIKWLSRQARNALLRKLQERKHHYTACVRTAAWKLRIDFDAAANGL